jgi:hypothetical protein
MHIEFLVEEISTEQALYHLIPRIIGGDVSFNIHSYQGKQDFLKCLPSRLEGYSAWIPNDWGIVVLIDEDRQNCKTLKKLLEGAAERAGLATKSSVGPSSSFNVLNRVAIEELEAWFFGDVIALGEAFPRISEDLDKKARYRDPDAIAGGTWEALERVMQRAGYFQGGLAKIEAAREISQRMEPHRNRSTSFCRFRDGLLEMVGQCS